ncbi:hypothetical protein [uncultured Tateyamaria sp.]|uniref:hypothetical protein n=1 Tax=Tateyamaria sp. 1078 TaxID=3417464 RepID=UPI002601C32A|nr:hypothetical protein [uncultured Tateyamaria sp.]
MRHHRITTLLLAAMLALSTHGAAMADQELTFQTWCIGRHSVDIPTDFEPLEDYGTINAMQVEALGPGDQETLDKLVAQRAEALATGQATHEDVPLVARGRYRESELQVLAHELEFGQEPGTSYTWTEEAYVLRDGAMMRVVQVLSDDEEETPRAQMLDLARKVIPRSRAGVPKSAGSCLPEAFATVPATTEVHGMTFVPKDADGAPVGLEIMILSRSPDDPVLDPDWPDGENPQPITIAGLEGQLLHDPDRLGPTRLAVVHRAAEPAAPALRIEVFYYDERAEPGAAPYSDGYAAELWNRVVTSFRVLGTAP